MPHRYPHFDCAALLARAIDNERDEARPVQTPAQFALQTGIRQHDLLKALQVLHGHRNRSRRSQMKRGDGKLRGERIELRDQRRRERHAIAHPILTARTSPLARHADFIDAREPLRLFEFADMAVDLGGVFGERQKARDVERNDEMAGVGLAPIVGVEIDHIAAEHRAVERPGEKSQHDRKS